MSTVKIQDTHWPKILQFLRSSRGTYVGREAQCRRFIEAVLWITRSGAQWRLLPKEFGNWNSVYKRYARWCDNGIWELMHQHFADDPDMEYLILDSTVVRAHPCAAGALRTSGGQEAQALGRSGAEPVIPPRSNRKQQHHYDRHLYKERHLVECFINKIKHYRRIFSRFDKLAKRYLGFLSFASALIWLR
jgi:transposase